MFRNQAALAGDRRAKALAESRPTMPTAALRRTFAATSRAARLSRIVRKSATRLARRGESPRIHSPELTRSVGYSSREIPRSAPYRRARPRIAFAVRAKDIRGACVRNLRRPAIDLLKRAAVAESEESWADCRSAGFWPKSRRTLRGFPMLPHGSPLVRVWDFGARIRNVRN